MTIKTIVVDIQQKSYFITVRVGDHVESTHVARGPKELLSKIKELSRPGPEEELQTFAREKGWSLETLASMVRTLELREKISFVGPNHRAKDAIHRQ